MSGIDHESRDLAGAAYLSERDALPAEYDGPTRADLIADERDPGPSAAELDETLQLGIRLGWWT